MQRRHVLRLSLAFNFLCAAAFAAAAEPVNSWIAQDALATLEITQPKPILDLVLSPKLASAITALPDYQKLTSQPGYQSFRSVLTYFETILGSDWKNSLRQLAANGVALAIFHDGGALLIVDAEAEKPLQDLQKAVLGLVRMDAANKGRPDPVHSKPYQQTTIWTLGNAAAHAIVGHCLLLSNREATLRAAIDLHAGSPEKSLGQAAAYREAMQTVSSSAAARAFVNLASLKQASRIEKLLHHESNPMLALLLAGLVEPLRNSQWLALELDVKGGTLALRAMGNGKVAAGDAANFTWPSAGAGALPNLTVPRMIAAGSFYRDLHGFYAAKDKLFPERTSGLVFFENMLEIAFAGREVPEAIMAETQPEIQFVVARQQYDPAVGTPEVQAPAAAVVLRLRHPEQFNPTLEEAWQKMLGLANFTRGQKALPGMVIDRPRHGDVQFSAARFTRPTGAEKKNVPSRYNLSPSLAMVGPYAILSSTEGLACDLIDVLHETSASVKPLEGTNTLIEIDGPSTAAAFAVNRQAMAAESMVKDGISLEEAQHRLAALIAALEGTKSARVTIAACNDRPQVELDITFNVDQ